MAVTILLGETCYSAYQAVSKFKEHHVLISGIPPKWQEFLRIEFFNFLPEIISFSLPLQGLIALTENEVDPHSLSNISFRA